MDDAEVADYINSYFASFGPKLSSEIKFPNNTYIETCKLRSTVATLYDWECITQTKVELLINDLDIHKGSNIEGLNSKLLRE